MPDDRSAKQREAEMRVGWKMGGLGLEITAHVVAGALLGWGYDQWRGTAPRGITIGAIAGIVTGMVALVRGALRLNRELERTAPTKGRGEPIPYPDDDDEDGNNDKKHDRWDRENQNDWQRH